MNRGRGARAGALVVAALAGCVGAPWFMGDPLDGQPMIPATSRAGTVAQHRRAADRARAAGQGVVELAELSVLEERLALRSDERPRLLALLEARAKDWEALGRPIPLTADLERVIALEPARRGAVAARLQQSARAAGDRWRAIGENERAERAYRRADELAGEGRRLRPLAERQRERHVEGGTGADAGARPDAGPPAAGPPITAVEPAANDWLLGGPSLARKLLPLIDAFPQLMAAGPRSRAWADLLLAEDPTSPDSLEVAARIDAAAGRTGGAERKLLDMVFYSPDRAAGHARAAEVWQWAAEPRRACAAWERAARLGPPDDPRWCQLLACLRRDPGAGDPRAVERYLRERTGGLPCPSQEAPTVAAPAGDAGGRPSPDGGATGGDAE